MDDSTILCRCEEITVADVRDAVDQGAESFDDVKRLTRCGMGACQGKTCQTVVLALIAELRECAVRDVARSEARTPLRPVPMTVLAGAPMGRTRES